MITRPLARLDEAGQVYGIALPPGQDLCGILRDGQPVFSREFAYAWAAQPLDAGVVLLVRFHEPQPRTLMVQVEDPTR